MSQQGEDYNNTTLKFLWGLTEWKWKTALYLTHTQSIIQLLTVKLSDYLTMQIVKEEHKASSALSLFSSMPQTSDASRVQFNPLTSFFQRGLKQFKRKRRSTGPGLSSKILTTEENCVLFLPPKFSHLMLYQRPGKWEDSYALVQRTTGVSDNFTRTRECLVWKDHETERATLHWILTSWVDSFLVLP